ncbi:MAG: c-type cytochrome [Gemmatimonadota bacterium]
MKELARTPHGRPSASPARAFLSGGSTLFLVLLLGGPALGQEADGDTAAREGAEPVSLYTAEQADRGETTFRTICAACHLSSQFRGGAFRAQWEGRTAYDMVDELRATMPMDNPGGLSLEQYVNVTAYLLSLNRFEAGAEELPTDEAGLGEVRIPPDGASEEGG